RAVRRRGLEPPPGWAAGGLTRPGSGRRRMAFPPPMGSAGMATLTHDLASQLQGAPVEQVARQLGIDSAQASSAIRAALPLLMGALGRNAGQHEGAQALFGALQNDHAGGDLGSVLGAVLGGAQSRQTDGAGILGHIFGGRQARAEAGVAQATGLQGG